MWLKTEKTDACINDSMHLAVEITTKLSKYYQK